MHTRKIALLTGTSSGIGLAAAVALARAGHTTIATMRDPDRAGPLRAAAAAAGVELEVAALDVGDPASISAGVTAALERHGRIDVLVNNAGAGFVGSLEHTTAEDLRRVFAVNFFGTWEMTRAVLPAMRAAGGGRIIQVTSIGGVVGQPFNDAYCAAKFAVEGMCEALAPVVRGFGVHVTLFEPGAVASQFVANLADSLVARQAAVDDPYAETFAAYLERARGMIDGAQTPEAVGEAIVALAGQAEPPLRVQSSEAARQFVELKLCESDGAALTRTMRAWIAPA